MPGPMRCLVRVTLTLLLLAACGSSDDYSLGDLDAHQFKQVRSYTDRFQELRVALSEGYESGFICASGDLPPDQGAAGVHLGNYALVRDGKLDANKPEILIYLPTVTDYELVAVEYVVPDHGQKAPTMFGQKFGRVDATNLAGFKLALPPGEPPFAYYLHVWLYDDNPRGTFADGNPERRCGTPEPVFNGPSPAIGGAASGRLPLDAGPSAGDFLHLVVSAGIDDINGAVGRFDINHLDFRSGRVITKLHGRINCLKVTGKTSYMSGIITWGTIPGLPVFDPAGHKWAATVRDDGKGHQTFAIDLDFLQPSHDIGTCQPVNTDVVSVLNGNYTIR